MSTKAYFAVAFGSAFATLLSVSLVNHLKSAKKIRYRAHSSSDRTLRPPFPPSLLKLLASSSLAYLSTTDGTSPHLSLMNFTFDPTRQIIIMTSRVDTLKAKLLMDNPNVALLIHDFPTQRRDSLSGEFSRTYSVTLYGIASFISDPKTSETLREIHAKHNPQSSAFIRGENIGVLMIEVAEARICDNNDHVKKWKSGDINVDAIEGVKKI